MAVNDTKIEKNFKNSVLNLHLKAKSSGEALFQMIGAFWCKFWCLLVQILVHFKNELNR